MLGILVQLLISWFLLWVFEKQNLSVLGFKPTKSRIAWFLGFFFLTSLLCSTTYLLQFLIAKQQWERNPALSPGSVWEGAWWNIKSVLFEELIFRGAILYLLIKRIGKSKAILISAIAFGIYHWFSHEVIGNPVQMAYTFFITGAMGWVLAFAYARTFSLYIPCAIHLGWNLTSSVVFSQSIIGKQIFIPVQPAPVITVSYALYFFMVWFPILATLVSLYFIIRFQKSQPLPLKIKREKNLVLS